MTMRGFHKSYIYSKPSEKIVPIEVPLNGEHQHYQYTTEIYKKFGPKVDPPPKKVYKRFSLQKKPNPIDKTQFVKPKIAEKPCIDTQSTVSRASKAISVQHFSEKGIPVQSVDPIEVAPIEVIDEIVADQPTTPKDSVLSNRDSDAPTSV